MKKTRDEVLRDILKRFEEQTEVVNVNPGSIVRTFSEVIAEEMSRFYSEVNLVSTMAFVSTAKGQFLDLLGVMINCARLEGEEDENYRVRMTNYVYVVAGANRIAIRLKLLEVEGVRDVILEEFTKGIGSFTAYIISDEIETSEDILAEAAKVVQEFKGYGIHAVAKRPVLISVNLEVRLLFEESAPLSEISTAKEAVKRELKNYADNIEIGGSFVTVEALRVMKSASPAIVDIVISEIYVNKTRKFVRNINASRGERIFLESVTIM